MKLQRQQQYDSSLNNEIPWTKITLENMALRTGLQIQDLGCSSKAFRNTTLMLTFWEYALKFIHYIINLQEQHFIPQRNDKLAQKQNICS